MQGVDSQAGAVGKGENLCPEEMPTEELWIELKIFLLDIRKDYYVVLLQHFFVLTRRHVVEIPGGDTLDGVTTARFDCRHQPLSIIDEVETFWGVIEGRLRIYRPDLNRPISDVVYFCHSKPPPFQ